MLTDSCSTNALSFPEKIWASYLNIWPQTSTFKLRITPTLILKLVLTTTIYNDDAILHNDYGAVGGYSQPHNGL
jgi:hypothetical protein